MELKDFILHFNTYNRQLNQHFLIDKLSIYDFDNEVFSCNFFHRISYLSKNTLFSFDNYQNLSLTNMQYNHDLYIIVNIVKNYYAYYKFSHNNLAFVVFKIYSPRIQIIFDVDKNYFKADVNDYFSSALYAIRCPHNQLLITDERCISLNTYSWYNNIKKELLITIEKLNTIVQPISLIISIKINIFVLILNGDKFYESFCRTWQSNT